MTTSLQTKPYIMPCDGGQMLQSLGALGALKASTEQTGGTFNLFESVWPVGFSTPLHIHYAEDVAVFVLEGSLTVYWGDEKEQAMLGSFCFQPRGTPHGFRVAGNGPVRVLYLTIPAGLDQFVLESVRSADDSACTTAAARHKIEILGPLPDCEENWLRNPKSR